MKIEEEIKQNKFYSEYQKLAINILFTNQWLTANTTKILKPFGISPQQYNVLRILKGQSPKAISVSNIMERMIDKMSNTSRLVEKLRQKELIERVTCEKDRRQVDVKITKKGLELLEKVKTEMNAFKTISDNLTEKEASTINDLLDKMRG
ncbi:MAG: MarR family transcriptional regulator [Flavobacteriales bacterium]|nr:MarR family transcriptional regulator [Flavobacteriales bacterium]MCW8913874.1 MarR family transcriptional regulator [Flavobacteriales bacterium]MCW8937439.1 MarR family transcriptional regulator [Flavobacteriales bacterium]MCW8940186.1 MarR family transcriptional regulator [Flavobacteriales bacterium]MCW8969083.1 MarR family transcriptional regulator [Flavobacteriales bacterium]